MLTLSFICLSVMLISVVLNAFLGNQGATLGFILVAIPWAFLFQEILSKLFS